MKKVLWTFVLISIIGFLMGCTSYQLRDGSGYYQPENWQEPIAKTDKKSNFFGLFSNKDKDKDEDYYFYSDDKFKPSFNSKTTVSNKNISNEQMSGFASWYGPGFHGKKTANGERYNQNVMTAAHKLLPMNSIVRVTNTENNKSIIVRINDRGPYKKARVIDLTKKAATKLGFLEKGTAKVKIKVLKYPKNFDPSKGLLPYKQVVIQLAVFNDLKNANRLKDKLSDKYQRINFKIDQPSDNTFHVVAGPYNQREQAIHTANALKSDGVNNFVRSLRK